MCLAKMTAIEDQEIAMNRTVIAVALCILALLSVACDASASPLSPPDQSQPNPPPTVARSPAPPPLGRCQSRLYGSIINATTRQAPPKVTIEIASGNFKGKTVTDANGLYGFAGLCAGKYVLTVTPPGGKTMTTSDPITLDGSQPTKLDLSFN